MKLIILNGPAGVGKSTISLCLHREIPNSVLIDIDELRRTILDYKERRKESLLMAYEKTKDSIAEYLTQGKTVIIDKAISSPDTLDAFIATARERGAEVCEVVLFAPKEVVQSRADERGYKPGSLLTRERVGELWEQLDALRSVRPQATVIDTETLSIEETHKKVKEVISDCIL